MKNYALYLSDTSLSDAYPFLKILKEKYVYKYTATISVENTLKFKSQINKLINDIKKRKFECILVYDSTNIDKSELNLICKISKQYNCKVYYVNKK